MWNNITLALFFQKEDCSFFLIGTLFFRKSQPIILLLQNMFFSNQMMFYLQNINFLVFAAPSLQKNTHFHLVSKKIIIIN
jgi:hypothetical protein